MSKIEYFNEDAVYCKATNGVVFVVDKEDEQFVKRHKWTLSGKYLQSYINGKRTWLHRVLINAPSGKDVDHVDMNGLNNQKRNLRICCRSENMQNSVSRKNSTSQYKGVCWSSDAGKWLAYINIRPYQRKYLGSFRSESEAAHAYNQAAKEYHGKFVRLNNVKDNL